MAVWVPGAQDTPFIVRKRQWQPVKTPHPVIVAVARASLGPHTVCGTLTSQTLEGTWGEMVQQAEGEVCWLLGNEVPQKTLLWPRLRFGMTAFP